MDLQIIDIVQNIITIGISSYVTLVTSFEQSSQAKRHSVKQSILQILMEILMEDQLNWDCSTSSQLIGVIIQNKYAVYNRSGGNGEVTEQVEEYNHWYLGIENSSAKSKTKSKGGKR